MGLADLLLRKHTAIAKVLIPSSMAFGFVYTLQHQTNPLTDAKNAALGKCFLSDSSLESHALLASIALANSNVVDAGTSDAPVAYTFKRSTFGAGGDNSG